MKLALHTLPVTLILVGCIDTTEQSGLLTQATVCPVSECGGNSASAGKLRIGEAHIATNGGDNQTNAWGFSYTRFVAPDAESGYTLNVHDGFFVATNGTDALTGAQLIGGSLRYENHSGAMTVVEIDAVDTTQSWTATPYDIERYKLGIRLNGSDELTPICSSATDMDDDDAWAVLISGERYDWPGKSVVASGAQGDDWFNIACVGNGLYKMKLMGYDPEPPTDSPYSTTDDERQATLKMLTADYCGTGTSFTEAGTALAWHNEDDWSYNLPNASTTQEAMWNVGGAVCLDTPRLGQDALAAIATECATIGKTLPTCDEVQGLAVVWTSGNPTN